jgi:hypothetical protein
LRQAPSAASSTSKAVTGYPHGLAGIDRQRWLVQLAVAAALVGWVAAMALDIRAIAYSRGELRIDQPPDVFKKFRDYSVRMRKVVRHAMVATIYAIGLTAASVALLSFNPSSTRPIPRA